MDPPYWIGTYLTRFSNPTLNINWALGVTCYNFLHRQVRSQINHNPSIFKSTLSFSFGTAKKKVSFKIHSIENGKKISHEKRKKIIPGRTRQRSQGLVQQSRDCRNGIPRISIETKNYAHTQKIITRESQTKEKNFVRLYS